MIAANLKAYVEAPSRREKSNIIDDVVSQILCYGGFVKKVAAGRWLSIGPSQAREKVGHGFRDCMKMFKGEKPKDKKIVWTEAQNSIFATLQLNCSSLPSPSPEEPMEALSSIPEESMDVRPDPQGFMLDDLYALDCADISDDDEPLEIWTTIGL